MKVDAWIPLSAVIDVLKRHEEKAEIKYSITGYS